MEETLDKPTFKVDLKAEQAKSFDIQNPNARRLSSYRIKDIDPDPENARKNYNDETLEELAASIKEQGLLQPISIMIHPSDPDRYMIISGHRRYHAHKLAGMARIEALLTDTKDKRLAQLSENLHREDLSPIDEALAIKKYMDAEQLTQAQVAERLNKDRTTITHTLSITTLPSSILSEAEKLANVQRSHLIALAKVKDEDRRDKMWFDIKHNVDGNYTVKDARAASKGEKMPSTLTPSEKAVAALAKMADKFSNSKVVFTEDDVKAAKESIKRINAALKKKVAE